MIRRGTHNTINALSLIDIIQDRSLLLSIS